MKKNNLMFVVCVFFFIIMIFSTITQAKITSVSISPDSPTSEDIITILVSGIEGSGEVLITDTSFNIDGNTLSLNVYLYAGYLAVMTPWNLSEQIDSLPIGVYDLDVQTIRQGIVTSTYSLSFEVVPEPTTFALFTIGLPIFRIFSKRKF